MINNKTVKLNEIQNKTQIAYLEAKRAIYNTCSFETIIGNKYLREAVGIHI